MRRPPARSLRTAVLAALAMSALSGGAAHAEEGPRAGWWSAASAGPLALPMPTTREGDLHVGQGPQGLTAYAALAYSVEDELTQATLTLQLVTDRSVGAPRLRACPADEVWEEARNAPLADAPAYDCDASTAAGVVAEDGTSVEFRLDAPPSPGLYSLAIVPIEGATPFQLDLRAPDGGSLTTEGSTPEESAEPVDPLPAAPVDPGEALDSPEITPPLPAVEAAPLSLPQAPLLAPLTPQIAPRPTTLGPQQAALARPRPRAAPERARYAAAVMLVLLAGGCLYLSQQPPTPPRLLGGMARRTPLAGAGTGEVRGIGRFAAERLGPPKRLR